MRFESAFKDVCLGYSLTNVHFVPWPCRHKYLAVGASSGYCELLNVVVLLGGL